MAASLFICFVFCQKIVRRSWGLNRDGGHFLLFPYINGKCFIIVLRRNDDLLCSPISACCQCSLVNCLICLMFPCSLFNLRLVPLLPGTWPSFLFHIWTPWFIFSHINNFSHPHLHRFQFMTSCKVSHLVTHSLLCHSRLPYIRITLLPILSAHQLAAVLFVYRYSDFSLSRIERSAGTSFQNKSLNCLQFV